MLAARSERATFVKKATSFFDYVTMPSAAERNDNAFDRYTDFRELWEAVSSTHPTIKGFHFPAKEAVFSSRSFFTTGLSSENIEEARRRKFNDLLLLLVGTSRRALPGGGKGCFRSAKVFHSYNSCCRCCGRRRRIEHETLSFF